MRRAFFFIVAIVFASASFASIPRASALDPALPIAETLSETRVWASDVLAPFERPPESELTRALRQAYEHPSTTNASGLGRFLSVDPTWASADPTRPQTWNRYSYVLNNPVNLTDPDGRAWTDIFKAEWWEKKMNEWFPPKQLPPDDPNKQALVEAGYSADDAERFANPQGAVDQGLNQAQAVVASQVTTEVATTVAGGVVGGVVAKGLSREALLLNKSLASRAQLAEAGEVIAGAGARKPFRDAPRVAATYGGKPEDWVKMRSSSYTAADGTRFETHWVQNLRTGQRVEYKTNFQ